MGLAKTCKKENSFWMAPGIRSLSLKAPTASVQRRSWSGERDSGGRGESASEKVKGLAEEVEEAASGSPSLVAIADLRRLLGRLEMAFPVAPDSWSFEQTRTVTLRISLPLVTLNHFHRSPRVNLCRLRRKKGSIEAEETSQFCGSFIPLS